MKGLGKIEDSEWEKGKPFRRVEGEEKKWRAKRKKEKFQVSKKRFGRKTGMKRVRKSVAVSFSRSRQREEKDQ